VGANIPLIKGFPIVGVRAGNMDAVSSTMGEDIAAVQALAEAGAFGRMFMLPCRSGNGGRLYRGCRSAASSAALSSCLRHEPLPCTTRMLRAKKEPLKAALEGLGEDA
jgi:hypothetical protein